MSDQPRPISRRHWIASALSLPLAGCGGGELLALLVPGTGGTGISVLGNIAGFGSVVVNGIRFDDASAQVLIDGASASTEALRLGMVARVDGVRDTDTTTGTASAVAVWSLAQGPLTRVSDSSVNLMGMDIAVDATTVLDGVGSLAALGTGQVVTVWGLSGAGGAGWVATRLATTTSAVRVTTGTAQVQDGRWTVNGWRLQGSTVQLPEAGSVVRVQGLDAGDGDTLMLNQGATVEPGHGARGTGQRMRLEGLVTALASTTRFHVGPAEVDASAATWKPASGSLGLGQRVEVEGVWQSSGVLAATEVEVRTEAALRTVDIQARVERFVSVGEFSLRGQRCDASQASSYLYGSAADLKTGAHVRVRGRKSGSVLLVTEVAFGV